MTIEIQSSPLPDFGYVFGSGGLNMGGSSCLRGGNSDRNVRRAITVGGAELFLAILMMEPWLIVPGSVA